MSFRVLCYICYLFLILDLSASNIMQFVPGFSNIETPRPSVFGNFIPSGVVSNDGSASWLQIPPSQMPWVIPLADQPTIMR